MLQIHVLILLLLYFKHLMLHLPDLLLQPLHRRSITRPDKQGGLGCIHLLNLLSILDTSVLQLLLVLVMSRDQLEGSLLEIILTRVLDLGFPLLQLFVILSTVFDDLSLDPHDVLLMQFHLLLSLLQLRHRRNPIMKLNLWPQ